MDCFQHVYRLEGREKLTGRQGNRIGVEERRGWDPGSGLRVEKEGASFLWPNDRQDQENGEAGFKLGVLDAFLVSLPLRARRRGQH